MPKFQLKKKGGYALYDTLEKDKIPEGESEHVTRNRPFHCFIVK
jgi:hypothetical protein